jgi:hypothetical protein
MRPRAGLFVVVFLLCVGRAHSREIPSWSADELFARADLVVVGKSASTSDAGQELADNELARDYLKPVLTRLDIVHVLKGKTSGGQLGILHQRFDTTRKILNGPKLMEFHKDETYLLFLRKRGDALYEPVTGQFDTALSFKRVTQIQMSKDGRVSLNTIGLNYGDKEPWWNDGPQVPCPKPKPRHWVGILLAIVLILVSLVLWRIHRRKVLGKQQNH